MPATPHCADCRWYEPPLVDHEKAAPHEAALIMGRCRRFPIAAGKRPEDHCGEHPALVRQREADFAKALGYELGAALAAWLGKGER